MAGRRWAGTFAGMAAGAAAAVAAAAAWRLYSQRPRERITCQEAIEDPEIAEGFARISAMPQMALARYVVARRAVALVAGGRVADIGCGTGELVREVARQAPALHVTGIDLSVPLLTDALRTSRGQLASRIDFRSGDAAHTPFETGSLDLVVSTLSLHHWSNPVDVLNEIARILRPGGAFLIIDLRRDMAAMAWFLLWFASRYVVPQPLRRQHEPLASRDAAYTPAEAARLAQKSTLTGWRVSGGPLWLIIEGRVPPLSPPAEPRFAHPL